MLAPRFTLLVLGAVLAFAGCEGGTDEPLPPFGISSSSATVRFVNATTGGSSFDLLSAGTATTSGTGLAYQSASSCLTVPASAPNLTLQLTGTTNPIGGFAPALLAGSRYTIVAVGPQPNSPQFLSFTDAFSTPASGRVRLRIINATTILQGSSLDVFVNNDSTLTSPIARSLGAGSATLFFDVPAGTTRIRLTTAGTQTVVLDVGTITLASGAVQSIVVTDPVAGGSTLRSFPALSC